MGNEEKENFKQALCAVTKAYGIEILEDFRRTNALLMDYAPMQARERKLILSALKEGIGSELLKARGLNENEVQECINRCVRCLLDETWITEEAARFAVESIAYSLSLEGGEPAPEKDDALPPCNQESQLIKGAFSLEGVNLSELLLSCETIGYKAFSAEQSLTELTLPSNIKVIKAKAFFNCTRLKRIVLPPTLEVMGPGVFFGCHALETISLEKNARYAFVSGMLIDKKEKALLKATKSAPARCVVPREVAVIGERAFERSEISNLILPRNLSSLSKDAFVSCTNLQSFELDARNERFSAKEGVLHSKDGKTLLRFPSGRPGVSYILEDTVASIAEGAFSEAIHLETLTCTGSLKSIGARAFEYCPKLSSLVLPGSVERVGERAFQYCGRLFSVMLPRSIQEVGDYAFCGCTSIQTVSIPRGVKRIGHAAFKDCVSLKRITMQENVAFIGDGAFAGCAENLEIAVKNNPYIAQYCNARKLKWIAL